MPTNAGEIMLSRAESAALAAMETEPNEAHGRKRAKAESGLSDEQLTMLQRRAKHALSKGITLKGPGFVRKPTATPEEPSLLRADIKAREAIKEANAAHPRHYETPHVNRLPVPNSLGEDDGANSVHTLSGGVLDRRPADEGEEVEDVEETNSSTTMRMLASMAGRRKRRRSVGGMRY